LSYRYSYKASCVRPSLVILISRHSDAERRLSECPDVKNYKWRFNLVYHRMLISVVVWQRWASKG